MSHDITRFAQLELSFPILCKCGCGQEVPPPKFPSWQRQYISGHQPAANRPVAERFWEKVDKRDLDDCWEWQGGIDTRGYGVLKERSYKLIRAHRLAWILTHGEITDDLWVLHKCDNRKCCNPNHLFLGTCQDNHDDMVQKSRQLIGEKHPQAKFSSEQVAEIRRRYAAGGILQRELATEYGTTEKYVHSLVTYRKRKKG